MSGQAEVLPAAFGENTAKVLDYAKAVEGMRVAAQQLVEKEQVNMPDVVALKTDVQTFLAISKDVLSMLYTGLMQQEQEIDGLVPTADYLWEKNTSLLERLKQATETLGNPADYQINQIMENLPTYLSYVDEAVQTLTVYSERKEFLNYPLAQAAIEEQLKLKTQLTPKDLPFQPRFAGEYLHLDDTQRYGEFVFDRDSQVLSRRP